MANNMVFKYSEDKVRTRVLGATHQSGVAVLIDTDVPAVTIGASGDATLTKTGMGDITSITYANGAASTNGKEVTVATDGSWEFPVADIAGSSSSTPVGTKVYITSGLALTLTAGGNTFFGHVDYVPDYDYSRGLLPIKVGA